MEEKVKLDVDGFWKRLMGVTVILTVFIGLVSGGFLAVHNLVTGPYCNCGSSLLLTVIATSVTGVIVGISIYYYLSGSFQAQKKDIREKALKTVRFLPKEQRKIMNYLIDESGEALQKDIVEETDLGKVKVSRTLKKMKKRGLIEREENGMSKRVEVIDDFADLLVKH